MTPFDAGVSQFFSSLAGQHPAVTSFFSVVTDSYFLKGQVIMVMLWWVWFYPCQEGRLRRQVLLMTLLGCVLALALGRVMVSTLPLRLRPNDNPVFRFPVPPFSVGHAHESSFPSDHAILFVALATGIFLASRRVGTLALAYVGTLICLPRLWLGFHFLSDLVAGALIGGGLVLLLNQQRLRTALSQPLLRLLDSKPHVLYAGLFLFSYQVAELFDPVRDFLSFLHHHVVPVVVSTVRH